MPYKKEATPGTVQFNKLIAELLGRVAPGGAGRRQIGSPRKQPPLVHPKASNTRPERLFRNTKKRNPMSPGGGNKPALDPRFLRGTKHALNSWLLTNGPTPFCLCKPFSCKACPGTGQLDRHCSLCLNFILPYS